MRITKTIKIAMKELIDEGYYVLLLNNEVFDFIATSESDLRFIKTIYTDVPNFSMAKQKERLARFFKYPQFTDHTLLKKRECFSKELWIRSIDTWESKIVVK